MRLSLEQQRPPEPPPEPRYCEGCHRDVAIQPHSGDCTLHGNAAYIAECMRKQREIEAGNLALTRLFLALETQRLKAKAEAEAEETR